MRVISHKGREGLAVFLGEAGGVLILSFLRYKLIFSMDVGIPPHAPAPDGFSQVHYGVFIFFSNVCFEVSAFDTIARNTSLSSLRLNVPIFSWCLFFSLQDMQNLH